ncbi:hypothetical protein [Pontibacter sp. HSC-36F09]|uniref:hypothetical protein n=1 Tax=Pontibacter sp. HSC-36F09 TaxID=2910966 RepID=UPI00209F73F7|nr:hypothetical protein [Pontibacter sp. HSC-36F09]MCP2042287.1 hypothetical protein [Pontibacter sp. HSC-36F09]
MQEQLQAAFDKIKGLPLTKTTRSELVQYFHFGKTSYTTPQGLILDVGLYTLAVNCPWTFELANGETIKHSEVFMRKREPGLPSLKFDWKVPGANLRDQRLQGLVISSQALAVESAEIKDAYGIALTFVNGDRLTLAPDLGKPQEEYWQLFSNSGDNFSIGAGAAGIVESN